LIDAAAACDDKISCLKFTENLKVGPNCQHGTTEISQSQNVPCVHHFYRCKSRILFSMKFEMELGTLFRTLNQADDRVIEHFDLLRHAG
jgi:hypothetical protein